MRKQNKLVLGRILEERIDLSFTHAVTQLRSKHTHLNSAIVASGAVIILWAVSLHEFHFQVFIISICFFINLLFPTLAVVYCFIWFLIKSD